MEAFDYHQPTTIAEAVGLLTKYAGDARLLAGGQSLMPMLKEGILAPGALVSLAGIPELRELRWDEQEGLTIGAMVTQRELETSSLVRERHAALAAAISRVASVPVRNLGTLGGNLSHAGPGADPPAMLIALGATVRIAGPSGERTLAVELLFAGPYETVLAEGEVVTTIQVPPMAPGARAVYLKHSVRAIDPAIVGVAASATVQDGLVKEVRIGIVGGAPQPVPARGADGELQGRPFDDESIRRAAAAAAADTDPLSDGYASAGYRRKMVAVFVRRALEQLR